MHLCVASPRRYDLMAQFANSNNFTKMIVGDTASRLSVNILSNMAQGKGAHIAYDTVSQLGFQYKMFYAHIIV